MTFDPFLPCLASSSSIKSKYVSLFVPEKVSDYIRGDDETLSVRPIFGPSYCSHTATTTATKAATTIKAFLSSRPGWLASVPERGRESDEAKACVSKWLLHQMGTTWTFRTRCGNGLLLGGTDPKLGRKELSSFQMVD